MIHKTLWKPDTCSCEIEYEWDDSEKEDSRTHSVSKIIKVCDAHKSLLTNRDKYETVLEENHRKNIFMTKIFEQEDFIQLNDKNEKELKRDYKIDWSFDKDRNLLIATSGFTAKDKNKIKGIINEEQKFINKIIIK